MSNELTLDVYLSPAKPIPSKVPPFTEAGGHATWPASTSTLILGSSESLLVDTLMTAREAHDLSAWVAAHDQTLRQVYITHPHADHLFGLGQILADFPDARGITLEHLAEPMAVQTSEGYLAVWSAFFPGQISDDLRVPDALEGDEVELEGHHVRFIDVGQTDTEPSSIVHVPDLATVVSGDVAYNGIHVWMAGSTPARRAHWMQALDQVEELAPKTIVVGHKDPSAPDDDATRILDETRRYITDFDEAVASSGSPEELVDRMLAKHGKLGNPYTLWLAAWDQLGPDG
jgi:glyoxylase-like metal-dependent hydrolase (beta-lactamase superfamily II)